MSIDGSAENFDSGLASDSPKSTESSSTLNSSSLPEKHSPALFTACVVCRRAHTACDEGRPCKRCIKLNKTDQCRNPLPKKRGRPKRSAEEREQENIVTSVSKKHKAHHHINEASSDSSSGSDVSSPSNSMPLSATSLDQHHQGAPLLQILAEIKRLHEGQQRLESIVLQLQQENQQQQQQQQPLQPKTISRYISPEFTTDSIPPKALNTSNASNTTTTTTTTSSNTSLLQPIGRTPTTFSERYSFPAEIVDDSKPFAFVESCHFVFANSLFCKLFEYQLEELKGIVTKTILHPAEIPAAHTRILNHLLRSAKTIDFPAMTFRTKSGRTFLATSRNQLFYNGKDFPTFVMVQITEILGMSQSRVPAAGELQNLLPSEASIDATYHHIPKLWKMVEYFKEKQATEPPGLGCTDLDATISLLYRKIESLYREQNTEAAASSNPCVQIPRELSAMGAGASYHTSNDTQQKYVPNPDGSNSRLNLWDDYMNLESLLTLSPSPSPSPATQGL